MPSVAVVILNWNGKKYLEQFLPSVLASTYTNKRVIVADNASTDDSVSFLKEKFPSVELIINPGNEGFAKGYNTALKQVKADYYVLLNSDVEVEPGWIEPVIDLMESDKTIAACQPKLLAYHDKDSFEYAGACGGWIDQLGYPFCRGRVFEVCEKDEGQYNKAAPCFWASGASMFVRASSYHEMNGLDEYFFAHQEEIDLCWRFQLAGYSVFVQPASVVYHVGGGTLPKGNARKTYLNFRNNLVMIHKNLPWHSRCWKIPLRIMLNGVVAVKEVFGGNGSAFWAIAKAHRHYISWVLFVKSEWKPATKRNKNFGGWYRGSIVWAHFIGKKNTFSEIVKGK